MLAVCGCVTNDHKMKLKIGHICIFLVASVGKTPFIYQQDVSCLPRVSLAAELGESCPAHMAAGTISSFWPIGYLHGG